MPEGEVGEKITKLFKTEEKDTSKAVLATRSPGLQLRLTRPPQMSSFSPPWAKRPPSRPRRLPGRAKPPQGGIGFRVRRKVLLRYGRCRIAEWFRPRDGLPLLGYVSGRPESLLVGFSRDSSVVVIATRHAHARGGTKSYFPFAPLPSAQNLYSDKIIQVGKTKTGCSTSVEFCPIEFKRSAL